MFGFRDLSLRRKLTSSVMITTGSALLLAFAVLTVHEIVTARRSLVEGAETLAGVVGIHSSAALVFDDASSAEETLSALAADRNLVAAALYAPDGSLFASYQRAVGDSVPAHPRKGRGFGDGFFELFHQIVVEGETIGTLYLRSSTQAMSASIEVFVAVLCVVLVVALVLASLVATGLRRAVQGPIDALVARSEAMAGGDLTTLVPVEGDDEIGVLGRSFNDMGRSLRALVAQVRDNIRAVASVAETLETTSEAAVAETQRQGDTVARGAESIAQVTRSIQDVNTGVNELAETGRGTSRSIAKMGGSIARVAGRMDELAPAIETTSTAIGQLTASVEEIADNVGTLNEATATTERSLTELTASVRSVRDNAQRSHGLSQDAHHEAERGMRSVNDTIASMHEIETSFKRLEEIVTRLAERSNEIGEIVKVIDEVADETQLLSLNAAIIASQAGEQGSAFAVVADEVKRLAERTALSTREIAELVLGMRNEGANAVRAMGEGAETVERGVGRSQEAGDRLRAIMESSTLSKSMVDEIAGATESQAAALVRVEEAMSQVRGFVEQIHRSTQEQSRASGEIANMVEQVRALGNEVKGATVAQTRESSQINEAMEGVTRMIDRISQATEQQRRESEQIDRALGVFQELAEESSRRVAELERVTATLAERSEQLDREIGRFTV